MVTLKTMFNQSKWPDYKKEMVTNFFLTYPNVLTIKKEKTVIKQDCCLYKSDMEYTA